MANQVNFKTSTQTSYNNLGTKDVNTFYKTDDGHLYLGTHRLDNMGLTGYTNTNLNRAVNLSGDKGYITLPTPVTRTDSTATDLPLAASVGKSLQNQINSLNANLSNIIVLNLKTLQPIAGSTLIGSFYHILKFHYIDFFLYNDNGTLPVGAGHVLATLPVGHRPIKGLTVHGSYGPRGGQRKSCDFIVESDGTIIISSIIDISHPCGECGFFLAYIGQ